jgi:HupE/UreJ protein
LIPAVFGIPSTFVKDRLALLHGTSRSRGRLPIVSTLLLPMLLVPLVPSTANAHSETGTVGGFLSGFLHPLTGLDHVVAMVAVGLWGAFLGAPAIWILPLIFPVVMALGGALGILGVPMPGIETGIALSGVTLGLMVAFCRQAPVENCRSHRSPFCHFSWSCAWHGAARSRKCAHLCRRVRDRNRFAAPKRNRTWSPGALAVGKNRREMRRCRRCCCRLRVSVQFPVTMRRYKGQLRLLLATFVL